METKEQTLSPEEEDMDRRQAKADADYDQFKDKMAEEFCEW